MRQRVKADFEDPKAPSITRSAIHGISRHQQPTQSLPMHDHANTVLHRHVATTHRPYFGPNKTPKGSFKEQGLPVYISTNFLMPSLHLLCSRTIAGSSPMETSPCWKAALPGSTVVNQPV